MALRNILKFRRSTMFALPSRGRPAASEEIVDPPKDYYIVKDYNRNPFYMSMMFATKPGFKKKYDPFKKHAERRTAVWEAKYKNQQIDASLGWTQIFLYGFIVVEFLLLFQIECKLFWFYRNPLGYNFAKPSEF